jgi:hypothetical protein
MNPHLPFPLARQLMRGFDSIVGCGPQKFRAKGVLRDNVVGKLRLPLPIHIRDASRRGFGLALRVKLRRIE